MSVRLLTPERCLRPLLSLLGSVLMLFAVSACTLNTSQGGQTVISGPPAVRLAAPLPNATYLEGVPVHIQALVTNAGPDIDRVEVAVDDTIVKTLPTPNTAGGASFSVNETWPSAGAGVHIVSVTAFRADGSSSQPATASITLITSASAATEEPPAPTEVRAATVTPAPTEREQGDGNGEDNGDGGGDGSNAQQDEPDATNTPDHPVATFNQGANVRRGPGTNFVPPIGSFAAGQTADVVGVNPAGDWYKVRYYNADGWVFASLLNVSGDTSDLPVDIGPPTPIPVTPTPIPPTAPPATAVPQTSANLVAGNIRLDPTSPECNETFTVRVDIANLGSQDTSTTGTFTVQDLVNGQVQANTQGPIPIVGAGKTVASAEIPLTVSTNHSVEHTIVVVLNPNASIPETNAGDNRGEVKYTLQKGGC
jgi:hypothetical protein